MSDEKQMPAQGDYSLDDILTEVSSWSSEDAAPPLPGLPETEAPPVPQEQIAPEVPTVEIAPEASSVEIAPKSSSVETAPKASSVETASKASSVETAPKATEPPPVIHLSPKQKPEVDAASIPAPTKVTAEDAPPDEEEGAPLPPPPDNLIPFAPPSCPEADLPPEPETIREAAVLTARRVKTWINAHRQDYHLPHVHLPIVKIPRLRLRLPQLPPLPTAPDTPPKELAAQYAKTLPRLRLQTTGALCCTLLLLLIAFVESMPALPLPDAFKAPALLTWISGSIFVLVLVFSYRLLLRGLTDLFCLRFGLHSLAALSALAVLADALTLQLFSLRPYSPPLFAPAALVLTFHLWGSYWKQQELWKSCRTAAGAAAPDLMTAEPSQWNGLPVYRRRFGAPTGFGSQLQAQDFAEQRFRKLTPLLLLASLLFSLLGSLLCKSPQLIPWSLSATLISAATLSGSLCFSLPFRGLSRRLSKLGVALAGWAGIQTARTGTGLLVEDSDLFPLGSVSLTSFRVIGSYPADHVISVTASLIRAAGCGLDPLFYSLLRTEGGNFVSATELDLQSDGISARVATDTVLVGNLSFLARMGVDIPPGMRVTTGVFCAIGGSFAGQFILEYSLHKGAFAAMSALLTSRITPILIGLDFNLVPAVLRKLFLFPWDKMAFPDISQRAKLRVAPVPRDSSLLALLCLQGLGPVSAAAVGAQRLHRAVVLCSSFTAVGAGFGVLLTAYLASTGAFVSLSPIGLCLFLLSWFLPTLLISGWVNQF